MLHLYEMMNISKDSDGNQEWEVWKDNPGMPWQDEYMLTLENENEFQLYLDICRAQGLDFVIHTLEEYDEYNLAVPSL